MSLVYVCDNCGAETPAIYRKQVADSPDEWVADAYNTDYCGLECLKEAIRDMKADRDIAWRKDEGLL